MSGRFGSGGPYEEKFGYSRVVASGPHAWVAGCTSIVGGELVHEGDAAAQARAAFAVALQALDRAGFGRADVVRTRMFVVDIAANGDAVAGVHGEVFADVRPAASLLGIAGLVDPRMLVEVEVEAFRGEWA
jgi:enamine deaminase RidA (YjgF/YER057c/UK114 family)